METLLKILDETTALTKDTDLFAYEIGLDRSGAWLSEVQTPSTFNGTGYQEFDLYVRFKDKAQGMKNIKYLKTTIDALSGSEGMCKLADGTTFKLTMLYTFDFLETDSEHYYVWTTRLGLLADEPKTPPVSA